MKNFIKAKYILYFFIVLLLPLNSAVAFEHFSRDSLIQVDSIQIEKSRITLFQGKEPALEKLSSQEKWVIGGIIVTAWTAYLLRDRANYFYKKYSLAGKQKDIERYWNLTQRYDAIANSSLAISGVLTLYLFYHIIKE